MFHIYMPNNMKKIINILFFMAVLPALFACSGTVDADSLPILSADKTTLDISQGEKAVLTVKFNGQDVTAESEIFYSLVSHNESKSLNGNVFIPEAEGEYVFIAKHAGMESSALGITVNNTSPSVENKFDRHVCIVEFTGAWCINCPEGYSKMMGILSKPTLAKYKENIHICAFHSDQMGEDALALDETEAVFNLFKGLSYPSFATDLRDSGLLTSEGISFFRPSILASFNEYQAHCGVSVSSVLKESAATAEVTVRLASEYTSPYRVVVLVVEDNIKGYQKTEDYPEGDPNYNHSHVVRKVVTKFVNTFTGEKMTDDGSIPSGSEAVKTWSVEIDSSWVLENTSIYALALDANGYVNNMNVCAIDGGDSGFDLKQ